MPTRVGPAILNLEANDLVQTFFERSFAINRLRQGPLAGHALAITRGQRVEVPKPLLRREPRARALAARGRVSPNLLAELIHHNCAGWLPKTGRGEAPRLGCVETAPLG